jgi:hypothetical protein
VAAKRHHYVPRFLLQRFTSDPSERGSHLFRLDKKTGANRRGNPLNEAVIGHYYRLVDDAGNVDNTAEEVLNRIEAEAAEVIGMLANPEFEVTGDDVQKLILFVVMLKNRTPQAREALRENDERAGELLLETQLSDRDAYHRALGRGRPEAEVETERLEALEDLRAGRIGLASSPEREVALMFLAVERTTTTVFNELGVVLLRAPAHSGALFVTSDHPVTHYDPTPKMPEAGRSFMSSPNSVTFIALDPHCGLLLTQDAPRTWHEVEVTDDDVDEANLLTYAWAREAIYGPTQEAVARVRRNAKANPKQLAELAYRPPRLWVTDHVSAAGHAQFTSRYKSREATAMLQVAPEALDDAHRSSASPEAA